MDAYQFFKDFAGPASTTIAAIAAGFITWKFQSAQVETAKRQSETARMAAETARNKLKFDLFAERHRLYQVVVDYMNQLAALQRHQDLDTEKFFRDTAPIKWVFPIEVYDWIDRELMPYVQKVLVVLMNGPHINDTGQIDVAKTMEASSIRAQILQQYARRDEVFSQYLQLHF